MYVCLCLCLSLYGREVTVGYARLRGGMGMGATFCHLAALRSAIEFLFWDHWETAVLGPNPSREVTEGHGSKFLPFGGTSIMAYATTTFLCGTKKVRARGWLSSPLLRCYIYISYLSALHPTEVHLLFLYAIAASCIARSSNPA